MLAKRSSYPNPSRSLVCMYRQNYMEALRSEVVGLVEAHLTPMALKYGYAEEALETTIKWRPQVLILGNYSSGKSTLINELVGCDIQKTGQAPTDDSFTIITYDDQEGLDDVVRLTESRDGKVLLGDPSYPFSGLKKHGERFASHFRLKKSNSPFLRDLSIIDTPGMLDSVSERDRGYNYQEVIGDLAGMADLILVLFDPHKAGTIREAHASLRATLPMRTFEDRVIFVLNRIDECESLQDLLRVYGTLCWNLSQMTGRKDIPPIRLTYSDDVRERRQSAGLAPGTNDSYVNLSSSTNNGVGENSGKVDYLSLLANERLQLKEEIARAPRYRLDHLASYVEIHGERLAHFAEALLAFKDKMAAYIWRRILLGLLPAILVGIGTYYALLLQGFNEPEWLPLVLGPLAGVAVLLLWSLYVTGPGARRHRRYLTDNIGELTKLGAQDRRDNWRHIEALLKSYLEKTKGQFNRKEVRREYEAVQSVCNKSARDIRSALNELATIRE